MTVYLVFFFDGDDDSHSFCGAYHSHEGAEACVLERMDQYSWIGERAPWERTEYEWTNAGYKIYIEPYEVQP